MNFEKLLLRSEDEMDFLPIIPLNDSDEENNEGIEIPSEIALLPFILVIYVIYIAQSDYIASCHS